MRAPLIPLAATLLVASIGGTCARAAVITDGTFSSKGSPSLIGWSSTTGVGATSEASFASCCGGTNATSADLAQFGGGGTSNGILSQTFTTIAGEAYALVFLYGTFGDNEPQSLAVSAANLSTKVTDANGSQDFSDLFIRESFIFIASSTQTTLMFKDVSATGANADGLMENVVVTAVPEPGSAGLLAVAGLGLCAVWGVRKRKQGLLF